MKTKTLLQVIIIYTFLILYAGLWSELAGRIKFNQWDIIGPKGRVTNHNLYSSLYILGIVLIAVILFIKNLISKYIKK
jgi:nitric oxide reductase large subunit